MQGLREKNAQTVKICSGMPQKRLRRNYAAYPPGFATT